MPKPEDFTRDAPATLHAKLDRLWIVREVEGAVTISTFVRDPDTPNMGFQVDLSITACHA